MANDIVIVMVNKYNLSIVFFMKLSLLYKSMDFDLHKMTDIGVLGCHFDEIGSK